jgi:hypothetical protein
MNKIYIIFVLACLSFFSDINAQNFDENTANEKYWYYRNRLYYFVKPGLKQSESNVAGNRNHVLQTTIINNNDRLK